MHDLVSGCYSLLVMLISKKELTVLQPIGQQNTGVLIRSWCKDCGTFVRPAGVVCACFQEADHLLLRLAQDEGHHSSLATLAHSFKWSQSCHIKREAAALHLPDSCRLER
jgi:hypothetical protein